ncbi:alpha/beta fold hydrolase [Streptomyces sp. NRRL S-118]|uniref:alpha/beta fold hydrolase n=1 Tax=Streptomyces sp. NRRL S-118 TaxID=1463881 RepID=UPI0004CBDD96|nr:alpha/beta hydrolase [Streptomyces sp. NRRL S-118]
MGELIKADTGEIWVERRGNGPDVLLIAGLSDPAEAWQAQLDGLAGRYRLTAYDNRGTGRTPLPEGPLSVPGMAEDAAAVLHALGIPAAHVMGFSGGSRIAQELALNHPRLVRSLVLMSTWGRPDAYLRSMTDFWHWMSERAPTERAMLAAFLLWIYTPRAHADGTVDRIIEETLAFPYPQSIEAFQRQLAAFRTHDTLARLAEITAPTLVLPVNWTSPHRRTLAAQLPRGSRVPSSRCCRADERDPGNYLAFLGLAAALCCYKRLIRLTTYDTVLVSSELAGQGEACPGSIRARPSSRQAAAGRPAARRTVRPLSPGRQPRGR